MCVIKEDKKDIFLNRGNNPRPEGTKEEIIKISSGNQLKPFH